VNYHFGSKEELLRAVIERRLVPLNKTRTKRLQAVMGEARQKNRRPEAREVLKAFIEPTFSFKNSGPGAGEFIALIGRSFSEPDGTVRAIFMQLINPLFMLLSESLAEAVPELPRKVFLCRLHFIIGAMVHTLHMPTFGHECGKEEDAIPASDDLMEMFLTFVTSGLKAPD